MDPKLLASYFVIAGLVVSAVIYSGSQGKSELAVFVAFLPGTTLITPCTIYLAGGTGAAVSYAESMLVLLPHNNATFFSHQRFISHTGDDEESPANPTDNLHCRRKME
ncbi:MAG: hypothetical protein WBH01_08925 [Dehalococcoidia bacterium]